MNILYVENHEVFAANVTRQFLGQHTVTIVPSIVAARVARETGLYDLVLVDFDLDDAKGDTLVKELRNADADLMIIGVSSHDEGNNALLQAGASAICSKMEFDRIERVINDVKNRTG